MRDFGSRWKLIPLFFSGRCLARRQFTFTEKLYCVFPQGKNRGAGFWWPRSERITPLCWRRYLRSGPTRSCPSGYTFRNRPPDLNRPLSASCSWCADKTRELAWCLARKRRDEPKDSRWRAWLRTKFVRGLRRRKGRSRKMVVGLALVARHGMPASGGHTNQKRLGRKGSRELEGCFI